MSSETYIGPYGGVWSNPANWSDGAVPVAGDTVLVNTSGPYADQVVAGIVLDVGGPPAKGDEGEINPTFTGNLGTAGSPVTVNVLNGGPALYLYAFDGTLNVGASQTATILTSWGDAGSTATVINGTIEVGAGATLTFAGDTGSEYSAPAEATIDGSIVVNGGTVFCYGFPGAAEIAGSGTIMLLDDATFSATTLASEGPTFVFGDGTANILNLGFNSEINAKVEGFGGKNVIEFDDPVQVQSGPVTVTYAANVLTIYDGTVPYARLTFIGNYSLANFDVTGGYPDQLFEVTYQPCFTAGTRLDTPLGERAVEDLREGDIIATTAGPAAIRWIGHRRTTNARVIRFRPHALGPDRPRGDLCVSHDHAMFVDGVLVPAGLLVNGATIVEECRPAVTLYHVELATHGILFAEGAPAESYLDTGNRNQFGNCPLDYDASQPGDEACAALVVGGPLLEKARRSLPILA